MEMAAATLVVIILLVAVAEEKGALAGKTVLELSDNLEYFFKMSFAE